MSLDLLRSALLGAYTNTNKANMSWDAFTQTEQERGDRIHRYRRYYDGLHDANMTAEMQNLLRVSSQARTVSGASNEYDPNGTPFNTNYMSLIVDTKVDRMKVSGFDTDSDRADEWVQEVLLHNRLQQIELQIAESASRDGDTYIFVEYDEETGRAHWVHEPAYDGVAGMVVLYPTVHSRVPEVAIKLWHVTSEGGQTADTLRVNTYTADEIRRYISIDGGGLKPFVDDEVDNIDYGVQSNPLGFIPIVHFRNNAVRFDNFGRSDIDDAIPIQDGLNRTFTSMVTVSELTAFPIRYTAGGLTFPSGITPGMFVNLTGGKPMPKDYEYVIGEFEAAGIVPFIQQADWLVDQIYTISKTPRMNQEQSESGEAKKQNEAPFLGRVQRSQNSYGQSYEMLIDLSAMVESVFGKRPPEYNRVSCRWQSAEIRNNNETVANANAVLLADPNFPIDEYYRLIAPAFGWDDAKVNELVEKRNDQTAARLARLSVTGDNFGALSIDDAIAELNGAV